MSKFYTLNKLNTQEHFLANRSKIKLKFFRIIFVIIFIIFISLTYLAKVNSIAIKGFKIKELEKKISQLKNENKKLEMKIIQLESTGEVEEVIDKFNLVKTTEIEYLRRGTGAVAAR